MADLRIITGNDFVIETTSVIESSTSSFFLFNINLLYTKVENGWNYYKYEMKSDIYRHHAYGNTRRPTHHTWVHTDSKQYVPLCFPIALPLTHLCKIIRSAASDLYLVQTNNTWIFGWKAKLKSIIIMWYLRDHFSSKDIISQYPSEQRRGLFILHPNDLALF